MGIGYHKTEKMLINGIKLDGWGDMAFGELNLHSKGVKSLPKLIPSHNEGSLFQYLTVLVERSTLLINKHVLRAGLLDSQNMAIYECNEQCGHCLYIYLYMYMYLGRWDVTLDPI